MIVKKLVINNFRSYYGKKEFSFSKGLNLILGANGDGKTTFFDAIQWVFNTNSATTDSVPLKNLASAKMFSELAPGSTGRVSVRITFTILNNKERIIEKSFDVEKDLNGKMVTKNYNHIGYQTMANGTRKNIPARDILEKEYAFPAVVKKYCLFKGESELNIFKDSETLCRLVELFSDIKDFSPYTKFLDFAEELAAKAKAVAAQKASKHNEKYNKLQKEINELRTKLKSLQERRDDYVETRNSCEEFIKAIEENKDTVDLIHNIEERISNLKIQRENKANELDENYSIKLLDDLWILYGFGPILDEFAGKMQAYSEQKQAEQQEFNIQLAQEEADKRAMIKVKQQIEEEMSKLPWYIPNITTMQSMLNAHRCRVCNTEAPEGSKPYEFMLKRLNEALEKKKQISEINKETQSESNNKKVLFVENVVDELHMKSMNLSDFDTFIPTLGKKIEEKIKENRNINEEISNISSKIEEQQEKLAEILAQSESISDYNNLWHKIRSNISDKEDAVIQIHSIDERIPRIKKEIIAKEDEAGKYVQTKEAVMYKNIHDFLVCSKTSLSRAESSAMEEFLDKLETKANDFLNLLNIDDFTGIVNIYQDGDRVKLYLVDKDKNRIDKPNTSLETTMHLSVLLAISELTKEHLENEYPLIFDAPTSTFDQGKDKDFYNTLYKHVAKQCIVVTKSFLNREENGSFIVDSEALSDIDVPVYRIQKKAGFDKTDLTSIETIVEQVK